MLFRSILPIYFASSPRPRHRALVRTPKDADQRITYRDDRRERLVHAQSDLLAKPPNSGHPVAVGIYHINDRFSLEPDRPFLGQSRR